MTKVLVANRGEIAVRIIHTLKERNIKSVAIYSEVDADNLHVALADESYCIGSSDLTDSYLNIDKIITVAKLTGTDAIHPGYGFLSERADFAKRCEDEGIKFIGPSSALISTMGDKSMARDTVAKYGLPVVPGSDGAIEDAHKAKELADEMSYPVIIKAASGGGGKGMRIVYDESNFIRQFQAAKQEAKAAFDDDRVYIEKYIQKARHIEVQVLGDGKGNAVHLYERDCSIQNHNQKLIEEAPAAVLDDETRAYILDLTRDVASKMNYASAGTIEYLYVEEEKQFYFMEMNTRIQVEHTITEVITGVDIVEQQLEVAFNGQLSIDQEDVRLNGLAIEVRINAESPEENFIPSPGKIEQLRFGLGNNVRIDSHIYTGYTVSPFYDAMIAKIIVHGSNRSHAVAKMRRVLNETTIGPIKTNLNFQSFLMEHPDYQANHLDIKFLENNGLV